MLASASVHAARRAWLVVGYAVLFALVGVIALAWQQERTLAAWQAQAQARLEARSAAVQQRLETVQAQARAQPPDPALIEAGLGLRPANDAAVRAALRAHKERAHASAAWLTDFTGEPILAEPDTLALSAGAIPPNALLAGLRGETGGTLAGAGEAAAFRLYLPLHAGAAGRSQVASLLLLDFPWRSSVDLTDDEDGVTLLLAPDGRVMAGAWPDWLGQRLPPAQARLHLPGLGVFARVDARLELGDPLGAWSFVRLRPVPKVLTFQPWLHWGGAAAALLALALALTHAVGRQQRALEKRQAESAAARTRAPGLRLPYIEGLDMDAGLAADHGDEARYLERLRAFLGEAGKDLREIHAHLAANRQEEAERALSEASERARAVGASVLQQHLDRLHASVRRRDPAAQIEPRLRDVAAELDKTLGAIWAALDKIDFLPPGLFEPPAPLAESELVLPPASDGSEAMSVALDFDLAASAPSAEKAAAGPLATLMEKIERQDADTLAYLKAHQVALARTVTPRTVVELSRRLASGDWTGAAALCRESL